MIRVPDTLFFYIKNKRGLDRFVPLNKRSIGKKRFWANKTPEEIARKNAKTRATFAKKGYDRQMSVRMKKWWKKADDDVKEKIRKGCSDGMKKKWQEDKDEFLKKTVKKKRTEIEYIDVVDNYSGTITDSQMEELNAKT